MTTENDNKATSPKTTISETLFGWKHLIVRVLLIALIASGLSYLQAIKVINVSSGIEAQLFVPAMVGLVLAILNFKLLRRIAIILLPLWFASAVAIEFAGIFLAHMFNNGFEERITGVLGLLLEYLPAAIAGHWLYSGYTRFARRYSIIIYLLVVLLSILVAFLVYSDFDIYMLQGIYLTVVSSLLSYLHMGHTLKIGTLKK